MTFHILQKNKRIDPQQIEDNFNHVFEGDWLPRNGVSLATEDATLNLGSDSNAYKTVHINNLEVTGEVQQCWNLISEITLTDTAPSLDIADLNGDVDEIYMIQYSIVQSNVTGGDSLLGLTFNGDSGTNYGYQYLQTVDTNISAARGSGIKYFNIGINSSAQTSTSYFSSGELYIYAKTGQERLGLATYGGKLTGKFVEIVRQLGLIWNDTSSTITSMKFEWQIGTLGTGSSIKIWAPR